MTDSNHSDSPGTRDAATSPAEEPSAMPAVGYVSNGPKDTVPSTLVTHGVPKPADGVRVDGLAAAVDSQPVFQDS